MKIAYGITGLVALVFASSVFAQTTYIVEKNDVVRGNIYRTCVAQGEMSEEAFYQAVVRLNPGINLSRIRPKQNLLLPEICQGETRQPALEEKSVEASATQPANPPVETQSPETLLSVQFDKLEAKIDAKLEEMTKMRRVWQENAKILITKQGEFLQYAVIAVIMMCGCFLFAMWRIRKLSVNVSQTQTLTKFMTLNKNLSEELSARRQAVARLEREIEKMRREEKTIPVYLKFSCEDQALRDIGYPAELEIPYHAPCGVGINGKDLKRHLIKCQQCQQKNDQKQLAAAKSNGRHVE